MLNNLNYDEGTAKNIQAFVQDARKKFVGSTMMFGKI